MITSHSFLDDLSCMIYLIHKNADNGRFNQNTNQSGSEGSDPFVVEAISETGLLTQLNNENGSFLTSRNSNGMACLIRLGRGSQHDLNTIILNLRMIERTHF